MADVKDRAREYLAEHSEYSEVFGVTFVAVDTLTAMVDFAEQETKELKAQIEKMKQCGNCGNRTIGNCEYCKRNPSQIFADTLTSDYWKLRR
jgi:hypothetical protein